MNLRNDIIWRIANGIRWDESLWVDACKIDYIDELIDKVNEIRFKKEKKMNKNEELKNVDTIIITRDGNTVSAVAYDGDICKDMCHRATATCGPNDIFDFNIGAKLALDRLYEGYDMTPKPKRKPYNGLIYIHEYPGCGLAERALYKVVDGYIANCWYAPKEPYIFDDMSDKALTAVIRNEMYGGPYNVSAHFVRYDKTKA